MLGLQFSDHGTDSWPYVTRVHQSWQWVNGSWVSGFNGSLEDGIYRSRVDLRWTVTNVQAIAAVLDEYKNKLPWIWCTAHCAQTMCVLARGASQSECTPQGELYLRWRHYRVGVTRCGNWWCHPIFSFKNSLSSSCSEHNDLYCH